MQHLLCYSAKLVEERKKERKKEERKKQRKKETKKERKKMNNADFRPFQVCHFKIVTIHIAITTADWGRLYKLLYVVLDASSYLLPGDYIAVKMLIHIYWSCHLGIGPSLHMGSLPVRKPIINTLTCTSKLMCTYINVALTYTNFQ